jgi:hypothetical protein
MNKLTNEEKIRKVKKPRKKKRKYRDKNKKPIKCMDMWVIPPPTTM